MPARTTILVSVLITCSLGILFIAPYWIHQDLTYRALMNSGLFVAVMAVLHLAGYRIWQRQRVTDSTPTSSVSLNPRSLGGATLFGVFLFLSGIQFAKYCEMKQLAAELTAAGKPFAPTMISEPAGWSVALLCFGIISLIAGFKKPTPTKSADGASK